MTKKEKPKTTINIDPTDMGPIRDLALVLGQTQRYGGQTIGSITRLLVYIMGLVKDFSPRVVASALAQENLAALAEALGQEEAET